MFDWLFEGRLTIYLSLAAAALILLGLWYRDRRRFWLFPVGAVGLLLLTYFLMDRLVETGREQIARKLQEMAAAVKARNADRIFTHISDRFTFQGLNKAGFRSYVEELLSRGRVDDLAIWDVEVADSSSGQVRFRAKPRGSLQGIEAPWVVRARFVQESGGEWRLESFQLSSPLDAPIDIPQLPR
jgi:hypothetical protein